MAAAPKFRRPDAVGAALEEDDADIQVDAADPLTGKVNGDTQEQRPPAKKRRSRSQLIPGSVTWDLGASQRLGALVAGERGLTRRAIHNVLLADFLALPATERRTVIARAINWEREMEP